MGEDGLDPLMSGMRDWIETRSWRARAFLWTPRLGKQAFRSLLVRVNLILLAYSLMRRHALLRIAGVES